MEPSEIKRLIEKYLDGKATPEEEQTLEEWYASYDSMPGITDGLDGESKTAVPRKMFSAIIASLNEMEENKVRRNNTFQRFKKFAVAASIILLIASWFLYTDYRNRTKKPQDIVWVNIVGENGKVTKNALPDGSFIWLKDDSRMRYDSNQFFSGRTIWLEGEAYFEVQHDARHPFRVHAGKILTTVLGTHFNISVSEDLAAVKVTVSEGRVAIHNKEKELAVLLPSQQLVFNNNTENFEKKVVDAVAITGWINGSLYFKERSFADIASEIERKYHVTISFSHPSPAQCRLTASFNANLPAKDMLTMLCKINGSQLVSSGNKFVISGNPCK
jgi:ferric-dicitrate binding protein FerR (iron transport regulator)